MAVTWVKRNPVDTDGTVLFSDVSFTMNGGDKIALLSAEATALTAFYEVLAGEAEADSGTIEWGQTISVQHLPNEKQWKRCSPCRALLGKRHLH